MAIDPVCGMQVDERTAPARAQHDGKTYYFCSDDCRKQFMASPQTYVTHAEGAE